MKAQSVKIESEISLKQSEHPIKQPTTTRIIRAVASSTAIETGESVKDLELRLLAQNSKFQELALGTI